MAKKINTCGSQTLIHIKNEDFRCYLCDRLVTVPKLLIGQVEFDKILKKAKENGKEN